MNNRGQLTVEYILLLGIILIIIITSTSMFINQSEKNQIMTQAQIGAQIGVDKNGYAIYYNDTFNNYMNNNPRLLTPTKIKITEIEMYETNTKTIELEVTAYSSDTLNNNEKYIIGSRINYYIRKTITESFNKTQTTLYYDPALTNNYIVKTRTVKWKT
ncbi:MAG: class III signal peptide-containing protein [Methanosphaera stadtmanae]|nr:class III signal peptide-containing protein [Methanosphaera stadtmanae]